MTPSKSQIRRKKKPKRLRDLDKVVDTIPISIVVFDKNLKVLTGNAAFCALFREKEHKLAGEDLTELLPAKMVKETKLDRAIIEVIQTSEPIEIKEIEYTPPGNSKKMINIRVIKMEEPYEDKALLLIDDVTEKVQLGEELRQAQKMSALGQFIAGVAHEVNNPISIISGYAQYILDRLSNLKFKDLNAKDFKEYIATLKIIRKESKRIGEITSGLLQFSRRQEAKMTPLDINKSIEETVRFLEHQLRLSDIKIIKNLADNLPKVIANGSALHQVFMNLLINAHHAMPKGGRLSVSTSRRDGFVETRFNNTGRRIPKQYLDRVFDPFFTTKEVGGGAGLGLSIVYSVIKAHNGTIDVESHPRKGTTFTICLPIYRRKKPWPWKRS